MATRSTTARIEPAATPSGNALLVTVLLGTVFLLFVAFLNVVKPSNGAPAGSLITEENFLYVALILYSSASALYIGFGVTGIDRYVRVASYATMIGFAANTFAAGHRPEKLDQQGNGCRDSPEEQR